MGAESRSKNARSLKAQSGTGFENIEVLLRGRDGKPEQLIELLQDMQASFNYLPEGALRLVAERLGVPLIEVYRVASFYKAFSLSPRGRHLLTVCMGTACHVRGAPRLLDAVKGQLKIAAGETTPDGAFTLERVNCLGCCALGPVVVLDGVYHDRMSANKLRTLIGAVQKKDGEAARG
jgi:NADH:ubiquinone oxidoreductase subunit E